MSAAQTGMLIATLFLARDITHREHLKVKGGGSYAKHGALGSFYESVPGLADSLAEAYQGYYETLLDIPLLAHDNNMSVYDMLRAQLDWIHENRFDAIPREQSAMHNIIDEI